MNPGIAKYGHARADAASELVLQHAPLVKRIAYHLLGRLPPNVQLDDLVQAGLVGLLEAARNYDPGHGASFETFAGIRIRGAMLDEIRRGDWVPRSVHRKARKVAEAVRNVENRTGRDAQDHEVAAALGIGLEEYHRILQDSACARLFSLDEMAEAGDGVYERVTKAEPDVLDGVEREAFKKALARAIDGMPERERMVLALYYDEELNLREIGEVLGVTESRVCQIHGQAMARLRARMADWLSGGG